MNPQPGSLDCRLRELRTSRFEGVDLSYFDPAIPAVPLAAGMLSAVRHSLIVDQGRDVVDRPGVSSARLSPDSCVIASVQSRCMVESSSGRA